MPPVLNFSISKGRCQNIQFLGGWEHFHQSPSRTIFLKTNEFQTLGFETIVSSNFSNFMRQPIWCFNLDYQYVSCLYPRDVNSNSFCKVCLLYNLTNFTGIFRDLLTFLFPQCSKGFKLYILLTNNQHS